MRSKTILPRTLFLGVAAAAWAETLRNTAFCAPKRVFWLGLPAALVLCLVAALVNGELRAEMQQGALSRWGSGGLLVWFGAELARTAFAAHSLCRAQFDSMAVLGLLPLLLLAGALLPGQVLDRSAAVLWGITALAALLCLWGLWSQLEWQNLYLPAENATAPLLPIYPEYFALGLLCPAGAAQKSSWMPLGTLAVLAAHSLLVALLFGPAAEMVQPGLELLRAVTLGSVSRLDAVFLLVWLAAALFRVSVLARAMRLLGRRFFLPRKEETA